MSEANNEKRVTREGLTPSDASNAPGDGLTIPLGPDSTSAVEPRHGRKAGSEGDPKKQEHPRINE